MNTNTDLSSIGPPPDLEAERVKRIHHVWGEAKNTHDTFMRWVAGSLITTLFVLIGFLVYRIWFHS